MKKSFRGEIRVAPDKSISHRGIMLGSIATGITKIENFLMGEDCLSTIDCFRRLGVRIEQEKNTVTVFGTGTLKQPEEPLYTGNSGTTTRLLCGLLSGYPITTLLSGDASLNKRPMKRVIEPLSLMGAELEAKDGNFCPIKINGKERLKAVSYTLPVASAQLKSALILAGLHADGTTVLKEKEPSRNHTEVMLRYQGADIVTKDKEISINPMESLSPLELEVPGDISSAAFFVVGALITKGSELLIKNVGVNSTRTGILTVLRQMGGTIQEENKRTVSGEEVCDLYVTSSDLHGVTIEGDIIPSLIDEIPIIAVAACHAEGKTVIKDAGELRVKETDRIQAICEMLKTAGVEYEEAEDGFSVVGTEYIKGGSYESFKDHRMAMSAAILSYLSEEEFIIKDRECVNISFPDFFDILKQIEV